MSAQSLKAVATGTKELSPVAKFSGFLDKLKPQMALALPKHMNADRMTRLALTAFSTNAALQQCSIQSIAASIMTAAQLGLEPGVNGAGFLIPYGQTCTFVPGWKGLVDLVSRSGRASVYTGVIMKDQQYRFRDGSRRELEILNETELYDEADITHFYAIGSVRDAVFPIIELWSAAKTAKHRDHYNKQKGRHYSFRDWEMYGRKVALLQVLKYMPSSIELATALDVASAAEDGLAVTIENGMIIGFGDAPDTPITTTATTQTANPEPGEVPPPTPPTTEQFSATELTQNQKQEATTTKRERATMVME